MADQTQADLDALAAAITPVASQGQQAAPKVTKVASGAPTPTTASHSTPLDPFEAEERQFKLEQMRKQAAFEDKKREMELEDLQLSIEARRAQLEDHKENKFRREMERENKSMDSKTKGLALRQVADAERQVQKRCNHKKGGNGLQGILGGRGDAGQYAVIKHTMSNGDMWVRCLRCGKTWKPPLERSFKNPSDFIKAEAEYKIAIDFQTLNSPSSSAQFNFSDQGQHFREQMEHVTLR
jgi:hypothetical protein